MLRRAVVVAITILFLITAGEASETVIHNFNPTPHGTYPASTLVADGAGNLYGTANGGANGAGVLYTIAKDSQGKWTQTVLHSFKGGTDGYAPVQLVVDAAGNLYGFSSGGGTGSCYGGCGEALKFSRNAHGTWLETVLFNFPATSDDDIPTGLIVMDRAGNLYGVTAAGGDKATEAVFELSRTASGEWTETVIHNFTGGTDGAYIFGLVADQSGNVFGTTYSGGTGNACGCGTVFELSPSSTGWTHSIVYSFQGGTGDGSEPFSLTFDSSGNLFGTTYLGGSGIDCQDVGGCGTIFELQSGAGGQWSESLLYSFGYSSLFVVPSTLVIDSSHNLYGTTFYGGTGAICYAGCGTVFELSPSGNGLWSETTLYNFKGDRDGYSPNLGLVLSGGAIYGTTSLGGVTEISGTIFGLNLQQGKWRLTTLYSFPFGDGNSAETGVIADASGNLYGTTVNGGVNDVGSVYEMSPMAGGGWSERVIYSFSGGIAGEGEGPSALIFDSAGNLYGTTASGGTTQFGTIFELSPTSGGGWTGTTLYTFSGGDDGWAPAATAGLIFDQSGNLYGTTHNGGANGKGTVFRLSPGSGGQWKKTVLYNFAGPPLDGQLPAGGLTMDSAGNLYGTTEAGGSSGNCETGCGTVFKLTSSGNTWKETVVYSFQGSTNDGLDPASSLTLDSAGNIFGTTVAGGSKANCYSTSGHGSCGVVFEISPLGNGAWTEKVLHEFANTTQDGGTPTSGVVFGGGGDLFGTTGVGGTNGAGTIYKLSPSGTGWAYSLVYNFGSSRDGQYPSGNLWPNSSGTFYGTTGAGGTAVNTFSSGYGTVFEFAP